MRAGADRLPQLGLHVNLAQFLLLVGVNALVGGMYGQERTVLPLLAESEFGLTAYTGCRPSSWHSARPKRWPTLRRIGTAASRCWSSAGCSRCRCPSC